MQRWYGGEMPVGGGGHCQVNGLRAPFSGPARLERGSIIGERRRVDALYRDIELVSLPEHTFKTSGIEASALIARSPRRGVASGLTALTSTVVPASHREEFLRLGAPVISRTAFRATGDSPTG